VKRRSQKTGQWVSRYLTSGLLFLCGKKISENRYPGKQISESALGDDEISENRDATKQISETALGEKTKTVNRNKTRDLAAGLEISSKAADIWVQTDEISCMMTEITTYDTI